MEKGKCHVITYVVQLVILYSRGVIIFYIMVNPYLWNLCIWISFQISTTTGELRHDNMMGLLYTLEDATKRFTTKTFLFHNVTVNEYY